VPRRLLPICLLTHAHLSVCIAARLPAQVLLQTSQGDMVIDLHTELAPVACKNFLKLCKCAHQSGAR
jgi:hypothetical protein